MRDVLLMQAKRAARENGVTLRALIEEGLRRMLAAEWPSHEVPDRSAGDPGDDDPLAECSWPELRSRIYLDRDGSRA